MSTTIKDISRIAGVSYSTVSRALNGKPGVSEATRKQIESLAEKMGYKPNAIARNLVQRQTKTLGLVIPQLTNPFYPAVAEAVEDAARERGYSVLLGNSQWNEAIQDRYVTLLSQGRVDGIIISPVSGDYDRIERIVGDLPLVYVGGAPQGGTRNAVLMDNEEGGYLAGVHLLEAGYWPIGFVGTALGSLTLDQRVAGFKRALRTFGKTLPKQYFSLGGSRELRGQEGVRELLALPEPPRAIFVENDLLAMGVLRGLSDSGIRVPDEVAVMGFDDIPFASLPEVGLTTVYHPKERMGKTAAEKCIDEIEYGSSQRKGERIVLAPEVVARVTA